MTTATAPNPYAAFRAAEEAINTLEKERAGLGASYEKATRQADAPEMSRIKRRQGDIGEEITAAKIVAAQAQIVIAAAEAETAAAAPILASYAADVPAMNEAIERTRAAYDAAVLARRNHGYLFEGSQNNVSNKRAAVVEARRRLEALIQTSIKKG